MRHSVARQPLDVNLFDLTNPRAKNECFHVRVKRFN